MVIIWDGWWPRLASRRGGRQVGDEERGPADERRRTMRVGGRREVGNGG
jgi:hypothetical protein